MTTTRITEQDIARALDPEVPYFMTSNLWWDCNCQPATTPSAARGSGFHRPRSMLMCEDCGSFRDESPNSRINELAAAGIHLPWEDDHTFDTLDEYNIHWKYPPTA